ncbi:MAG: histidine phosphatase family protein [Chloroflexi bacterium]|nr:histidine phosphatase family protein [Chloroflexota bacterium]
MTDEIRPQPFYITFLRHGESVGNAEARWQGQSDFPLTDVGRAQARALAERWQRENMKFDFLISSPLIRAKETAEIIASALGVSIEFDSLWLERDNGEFAGLTAHELRENFQRPPFYTPYDPVGGDGEGDWELFLRAGQALHGLLKRDPARYLVVSHGGMLNQVMHAVMGLAPQANNAGTRFSFGNTAFANLVYHPHQHRWVVDRLNDHAHWVDAE